LDRAGRSRHRTGGDLPLFHPKCGSPTAHPLRLIHRTRTMSRSTPSPISRTPSRLLPGHGTIRATEGRLPDRVRGVLRYSIGGMMSFLPTAKKIACGACRAVQDRTTLTPAGHFSWTSCTVCGAAWALASRVLFVRWQRLPKNRLSGWLSLR